MIKWLKRDHSSFCTLEWYVRASGSLVSGWFRSGLHRNDNQTYSLWKLSVLIIPILIVVTTMTIIGKILHHYELASGIQSKQEASNKGLLSCECLNSTIVRHPEGNVDLLVGACRGIDYEPGDLLTSSWCLFPLLNLLLKSLDWGLRC